MGERGVLSISIVSSLCRPVFDGDSPSDRPTTVGHIGHQPTTGVAHHVPASSAHSHPRATPITLHHGSALLARELLPSTSAVFQAQRAFARTRQPHTPDLLKGALRDEAWGPLR
jgi:hypothetical protein